MASSGVQAWHPGELAMQQKLGFLEAVRDGWLYVRDFMPDQHRIFHTSNLPFIPVTTFDEEGRPWASFVSGLTGDIGFVESPDPQTLCINTQIWDGDPLLDTVKAWTCPSRRAAASPERFLTAGLGIEFSTRRRNKFAGFIQDVKCQPDSTYRLVLKINETLGNCPKYINIRQLVAYPDTQPKIVYRNQHMDPHERLPEEAIQFIVEADTIFIGTVYKPTGSSIGKYSSHAGMNSRGGLPGFVRVSPADGRTVVIPDYSGNRLLNSLGNIEESGLAGLTIVSFTTGSILYLTGTAENVIGPRALKIMARQASLTTIKVTGFAFVQNALPVRQRSGTIVERSPYSPKVKYLLDEAEAQVDENQEHKAKLQEATLITSDIAIFKFKIISKPSATDLKICPGQAIVLDFMDWIGPPPYRHMADSAPKSLNDDRVRTWTVSSAHEEQAVTWFELTMREMSHGAVTGVLFDLLRKNLSTGSPQSATFDLPVHVDIVGTTGDFAMNKDKLDVLWIAGGIGITPFLAMLRALSYRGRSAVEDDIMFVISTREPEAMLGLMQPSLKSMPSTVRIKIAVFTSDSEFTTRNPNGLGQGVEISVHRGRVTPDYCKALPQGKEVFICGPTEFGDMVTDALRSAGVPLAKIYTEGFY